MTEPSFSIRLASWEHDRDALRAIREAVFIQEQQVPLELEWDDLDQDCLHVLAISAQDEPIGTARLLTDGHIGRMAVLKPWRGQGVGRALLERLLQEAKLRALSEVVLNAQTYAVAFYQKLGFAAEGPEFMEAGIAHRRMRRSL